MKRVKTISYLLILSLYFCTSCHENNDSTYFNGEIRYIEDNIKNFENIKLKPVALNGANYGWMAVYDSLMFFMNPKLSDRFFNVFNVDTGKEIGTFCNKGGGPDEVFSIGPIFQLFTEENDLKTLLFAPNEEKLLIWNITQSIRQGKTVLDKIIPYAWRIENKGACYNEMFLLDKNTLIAKVDAFPINDEEATLPFCQKRTVDTNKCLQSYSIYKQAIKNDKASIISEAFFSSNDAFKPDGTKIVQAMIHLPQLNIIDVQTGKVVGYRLKDNVDFTIFEGKKEIKDYYVRLQVDDNYIYVMYWGKVPWERNEIPFINTVYVFDWNGKMLRKMVTDHAINGMWIDTVRNRLYTTEPTTDDVFYCDLDTILKDIKD
ncbi:BF3164 family lipoprotein [Bacteroides thetaiotaomicron]|uniref:BF3164 family lipoprotein n=1 Tax=Bacteroides thetaiotaomicron TaxID=818 RepID=UPI0039B3D000